MNPHTKSSLSKPNINMEQSSVSQVSNEMSVSKFGVGVKRAIIAGGGTGGHFYPAFAIAVELRKRGWQVVFLIRKNDMAAEAIEDNGFACVEIGARPFPRSLNPLSHTAFLYAFLSSCTRVSRILKDFCPDIVIGTGAYVSFPAVFTAKLRGIPSIIHESNAKFGLANYISGFFADKTALGLPVKKNPFRKKSELTGTPVREFFASLPDSSDARRELGLKSDIFTVLVFGGSQGSRKINLAAVQAIKKLKTTNRVFQAIHITGKRDFEEIKRDYEKSGLSGDPCIKLLDYCVEMNKAYSASDLAISRSGSGTITELICVKKPSILIPLPGSVGDHQTENAKILVENGCAILVEENTRFEERLLSNLYGFIENPSIINKLKDSFINIRLSDSLQAAKKVSDIVEKLTS